MESKIKDDLLTAALMQRSGLIQAHDVLALFGKQLNDCEITELSEHYATMVKEIDSVITKLKKD
jgi:hypothetical protein